jgi:hypothetical protein
MKTQDYDDAVATLSTRLFGTDATGQTKNFTVQSVLEFNAVPSVVATNSLASTTISNINTYFTGTAGGSFAITFPAANPNLNGIKYVVMSTAARPNTTWISSGATFVGAPSTLSPSGVATPVCFQYNHSNTTWYISL